MTWDCSPQTFIPLKCPAVTERSFLTNHHLLTETFLQLETTSKTSQKWPLLRIFKKYVDSNATANKMSLVKQF